MNSWLAVVEKGLASHRKSDDRDCSMVCDAAKPIPVVIPRARVRERRVEVGRMLIGRIGRRKLIMNGEAMVVLTTREGVSTGLRCVGDR